MRNKHYQQLQQESGTEMDTLVSGVKNSSKHTVRKGYSYIYGTGDAASVYMLKINMTLKIS
jgi:outer membrane protein